MRMCSSGGRSATEGRRIDESTVGDAFALETFCRRAKAIKFIVYCMRVLQGMFTSVGFFAKKILRHLPI
jgi:hypothetical protein